MANWGKHGEMLREMKQALKAQLGGGTTQARGVSMRDSVTDLSFADNHPADLGSENFERSKDLSLRELAFSRLRLVDEALARIDAGSYGICLRCGESIAPERLEAAPESPLCLPCREREERAANDPSRRPVEEERLFPPFARSLVPGDPRFDSEDSWQAAARHNRRPLIYEDILDDEEDSGLVEDTDALTNDDLRNQLPD